MQRGRRGNQTGRIRRSEEVKHAVSRPAVQHIRRRQVTLEASGGITLENVRAVAETGVDYIPVGALTHPVPNFDVSLQITRMAGE